MRFAFPQDWSGPCRFALSVGCHGHGRGSTPSHHPSFPRGGGWWGEGVLLRFGTEVLQTGEKAQTSRSFQPSPSTQSRVGPAPGGGGGGGGGVERLTTMNRERRPGNPWNLEVRRRQPVDQLEHDRRSPLSPLQVPPRNLPLSSHFSLDHSHSSREMCRERCGCHSFRWGPGHAMSCTYLLLQVIDRGAG